MQTLLRRIRVRLTRVGGKSPRRSEQVEHRRLTRRRVAAVLCALAAAWVAFAVYREAAQSRAVDQSLAQLQQQIAALHQQIAQRQREIAEAQSDSWLAGEARRLGYVRTGERVYVPVTPGKPLPTAGGIDPGPLPSFAPPTPTGSPAPTATPAGQTPAAPTPVVVPAR